MIPGTIWGADSIHATFVADARSADGPRAKREDRYRIESVQVIRGAVASPPAPGWSMTRWESDAPWEAKGAIVYRGATAPLQYTSPAQVAALARSRQEFPAGSGSVRAVLIPIRKSAAWWALPAEERMGYFARRQGRAGHTQIGEPYIDRVFRRLYHAPSQGTGGEYDFLTYFEFRDEDEAVFRKLLEKLRDPELNPEWGFVDREWEIWTRLANREVR